MPISCLPLRIHSVGFGSWKILCGSAFFLPRRRALIQQVFKSQVWPQDVEKQCVPPQLTPRRLALNAPWSEGVNERVCRRPVARLCRVCETFATPNGSFLGLALPLLSLTAISAPLGSERTIQLVFKEKKERKQEKENPHERKSIVTLLPFCRTLTAGQCRSTLRRHNFNHESRRVIQMSSRPESEVASRS